MSADNLTIVLAHAAWADGSSWNKVTTKLQAKGFKVVAAQLPLTSLSDDVTALRRVLRREDGRVLLVGHSYAGAVISAASASDPKVAGLVYIAGVVPDEGETVGTIFTRVAPHPKAPTLHADEDGFLWVTVDAFREAIAPDASAEEASLMAATQKPISLQCLGEPLAKVGWKEKPSWFLIAENDRMVSPDTQRYTAERMRSRVILLPVDHTPLASTPELVAGLILDAAKSVQVGETTRAA